MPGVGKGQVAAGRTRAGAEGVREAATGAAGLTTTAGFFATAFLAAGFLAAGFAAAFLAAGFLAATAFFATGFLATAFFAAGFFAATFLAATFLATGFLATTFLAAGFLAATFFAAGFLAATFFAANFFAADLAFFAATISTSLVVKVNKKQHYNGQLLRPQHTASGMNEAFATKAAEAAFANSMRQQNDFLTTLGQSLDARNTRSTNSRCPLAHLK